MFLVHVYVFGRVDAQLNHKRLTCEIPHTLRETKYPPNSRLLSAALLLYCMHTVYYLLLSLQS